MRIQNNRAKKRETLKSKQIFTEYGRKMHKRITIFSPIGGMIVPTKTKKEVLYDMKKQLSILGAVALAASMTVTIAK